MAFGGRGRGRGGYGGGGGYVKPVPFVPFPDIPALGKATDVKENRFMAVWFSKFEKFCKSSPYYIEDANECVEKYLGRETERFSTRDSEKIRSKARLSDFITMNSEFVPEELIQRDRKEKRITDDKEKRVIKKVKWDVGSDVDDLLSKKLQEYQREKANEKKGEDEEDVEVIEEPSSSEEDDDDYTKNIDFDDDEDDFNMDDDNDDEPIY